MLLILSIKLRENCSNVLLILHFNNRNRMRNDDILPRRAFVV